MPDDSAPREHRCVEEEPILESQTVWKGPKWLSRLFLRGGGDE